MGAFSEYQAQARDMLQEFSQPLDGATPAEVALFTYAQTNVAPEAVRLVDAASRLLVDVASVDEFGNRLIELYHDSDPGGLAVAMANLEALATLAGRVDA